MADDKKIIFSMVGVSKMFPPHKQVLKDIYLSFFYGAKIGIIGLNGSGKSTLLKIIAGVEKSYQGEVVFSPGYSVGYLEQEPKLDPEKTVKEVVQEGVQPILDLLAEYEKVNESFGDPDVLEDPDKMEALIARQAELQDHIDASDAWNIDNKLERAMDALRCPPEDQLVKFLSGGERRRVALCRLLLQQPDILLLDEPTNHLDAESIDWLEQHLQQYPGTVIAITHDRYFLDHVAGWILELDRGEGIPWQGNYTSWLEQKTKRMEMEEKQASKRRKTLERELEWVRMAPKARQSKGKARLNSYDKLLNEDQKEREEKLEIFIPNGPRLGNKVIEAHGVAKAFGDKLLFDNLDFVLPPNGIVGVIGPNGAGKTTLFKLIMGQEACDKGTFEVGETVKIAYVDQTHKDIDPAKTVYQVVSGGLETFRMGGRDMNARAYLSRFNFTGADQEKLIGVLSGGERNRLHLAMALKEEGNVLLLDEPTNDIDVNTLRALEEGLENFAGCAVVISHDRWFLDRICTHILAFEGDSKVFYFEGSYSEYEENKKKRLGDVEPHRVRYSKLME
ncbi:energy-dependent translational throttle protein EttA [Barnesiella intestinihominis]|uniref:energy-dependent translational throttle protein EttA n=1 Tax=Barnesiella intestinihominis TaxID=487174 RepID=UPI00396764F5